MEPFELAGEWWLPGSHEAKVVGILRFARDSGFNLEIPFGHIGTQEHFLHRANTRQAAPLVYGELQNGRAVTLVDVLCTNLSLTMPGTGCEEHHASLGFVGSGHVDGNPTIDQARLEFSHLRDWVGEHPFASTHMAAAKAGDTRIGYKHDPLPDRELVAGPGWNLRMSHRTELPIPSVGGFAVDHDCYLTLDLADPMDLRQADRSFLGPIWRFLCFSLDRMITQTLVEIRTPNDEEWFEVGRTVLQEDPDDKTVLEPFMLLSLQFLGDRVGPVLTQWVDFDGDVRRAVSLLVGLARKEHVPSDLRFLAAAQALEALSRVDAREQEVSETEFRRRFDTVQEALQTEPKIQKWAARKLEYANQRATSELIRDLLTYIGDFAAGMLPESQSFLSDLKSNRNFYTHRDGRRAESVFEGEELHWLTEAAICLLKAAVIRRLGFTQQQALEILHACQGVVHPRGRVLAMYSRAKSDDA